MTEDFRPGAENTARGRGCFPALAIVYLGKPRFGRLRFVGEVTSRAFQRRDGQRFVRMGRFACDCGGSFVAELRNVKRGFTKSCGCMSKERSNG